MCHQVAVSSQMPVIPLRLDPLYPNLLNAHLYLLYGFLKLQPKQQWPKSQHSLPQKVSIQPKTCKQTKARPQQPRSRSQRSRCTTKEHLVCQKFLFWRAGKMITILLWQGVKSPESKLICYFLWKSLFCSKGPLVTASLRARKKSSVTLHLIRNFGITCLLLPNLL